MIQQKGFNYFESIDEFTFIDNNNIGKGSFGKVKLAFHLRTNRIYAIKIINIRNVTTEIGMKALQMEINIHPQLSHPHIIKLWDVIQEKQFIYLILQYAQNGNLFGYQNKKQMFPQPQAYVYFSQALSAIKYLHSIDIMHRDLKPQNLLLDKDYNIKICDFGWVTDKIQKKRKTFCGTYQYMAPQMIQGKQYDYRVDIWALGVLLYELLHGYAPFEGENVQQVKMAMKTNSVKFGSHISKQVTDLIDKVLQLNPQQRLKISQIQNHIWMHKQIMKNSIMMLKSIKEVEKRTQSYNKLEEDTQGNLKQFPQKLNLITGQRNVFQPDKDILLQKCNLFDTNQKKNKRDQITKQSLKLPKKMIKVCSTAIKDKQNMNIYSKDKSKDGKKNKLIKGHKLQKSEFSEFKNSQRIVTQACDTKKLIVKKKQPIRFNTQISQVTDNLFQSKSNLKKKKIPRKKTTNLNQPLLLNSTLKYLRKSLQFC